MNDQRSSKTNSQICPQCGEPMKIGHLPIMQDKVWSCTYCDHTIDILDSFYKKEVKEKTTTIQHRSDHPVNSLTGFAIDPSITPKSLNKKFYSNSVQKESVTTKSSFFINGEEVPKTILSSLTDEHGKFINPQEIPHNNPKWIYYLVAVIFLGIFVGAFFTF